ncbi:MAG: tRNA preQ1(34) S-adenosylmethionine ribosyltransferase-isomerase QueA [Candidatus Gracilibacteria bacterium]
MKVSDFDYNLPPELIAKEPLIPRDSSRLMVVKRETGEILHKRFSDLPALLSKNAVLVFNNSKVLKARLYGKILNYSKEVEILLTKELDNNTWECLAKPGKKLKENTEMEFEKGLKGLVIKENLDGSKIIKFLNTKNLHKTLDEIGETPLPPYLKGSKAKPEQYQTIYANPKGSVAAPTAGLHFTNEIFEELKKRGIETHFVTLHVGRGTFEPVKVDNIKDHKMHSEWFTLDEKTAESLNKAKKEGKRIIAVGTTSVRVLESCTNKNGKLEPKSDNTNIFIYPGYDWKFIDHMFTNFHLPKSTLLMLISSFAGKELIKKAYQEAIQEKYRFFSFGDAMLIL